MNYIRGAVSAISAPYQYYKDLPPINPSTLTGAIDVIVIQRPGPDGDTELACSPFHVRFGKLQVLRPSERKVDVSVNGQPIPYNMKIGEAGEAFFVFETDDDVPPDLITSPILQPTRPEEDTSAAQLDASTGRFGARSSSADELPDEASVLQTQEPSQQYWSQSATQDALRTPREPEFLDLNSGVGESRQAKGEEDLGRDVNVTPTQTFRQPSFLRRTVSPNTLQHQPSTEELSKSNLGLPSPPPSRSPTPEMQQQDKRADEVLRQLAKESKGPEVEYHHDVALDVKGYHSHAKETSDQTIRSSGSSELFKFPSLHNRSARPSTSGAPETQSAIHSARNSSPANTDDEGDELLTPGHRLHTMRATSEPPPDLDETHHHIPSDPELLFDQSALLSPNSRNKSRQGPKLQSMPSTSDVQEYSWEWGAFPTLSPMKTTFGKGGRLENGIPWKGKGRQIDNYFVHHQDEEESVENEEGGDIFGAGGRLSAQIDDEKTFVLTIDGKVIAFELSLVPPSRLYPADEGEEPRGRKTVTKHGLSLRGGQGEADIARIFEEGRIAFTDFMRDESLVTNPALMIKWGEGQYVTRQDGSPLMDALVSWRTDTLREDDEGDIEETRHIRSKSAPPTQEQKAPTGSEEVEKRTGVNQKPGSLSWVQWWGRQGTGGKRALATRERPTLTSAASAPSPAGGETKGAQPRLLAALDDQATEVKTVQGLNKRESGSAPALPSTPRDEIPLADITPRPSVDHDQIKASQQTPNQQLSKQKKFAKTLRLTSDQLKVLGLKSGANSITFSISSGVVACTARIFVWDYTDHVVISDIDGTITKSDGLGHVFAMIGRDWTHVGVAKLYTDIARNGYKIMYLTSRPIGQADSTRGYLKGIKQMNYQLPEGPVIMSPDRFMASLHREVIMRKPEVFKMACLRDIQRLFGEHAKNPFYAGFGNRITDALSYRSVNVPSARIFTIDSTGEVKMELLELAGYKSSYIHMTDLVDQMFPPIHRKWSPEYTDFNYWKIPIHDYPLPDLAPPSPTLSARSDTSNQSTLAKLRNFRLMGSRANSISTPSNQRTNGNNVNDSADGVNESMSSFGRLVSGLRRSVSPSSVSRSSYAVDSDSESEADGYLGDGRRDRRRSMTSMPGSLDDIHFGIDDDEDVRWEDEHERAEEGTGHGAVEGYDDGSEGEVDEDVAIDEDMAIDEDLLAATEMKKIPFL